MGGSTVAQFIWNGYAQALQQNATQTVNVLLQAIVPWVQAALALYVILAGKRMLTHATSFEQESTAVIRAIMICALLTPANFNEYITIQATQTIPNAIASAVNGQNGLAGAQGFDALLNQITHFTEQINAQAGGLFYIAERIKIWFAQATASLMIFCCLFVWILAQATISFLIPVGAVIIPFYLFNATREFTMRWVGKLISLFLVLFITMLLGAFVVQLDGKFMQTNATQTPAGAQANPGFSMNASDGTFGGGGFAPYGEGLAAPPVVEAAGPTANVDASIIALWNVALVCAFGFFILSIMVGLALYIGGSSGFSAAPAANFVTAGAEKVAAGAAAGARAAAKRMRR
jgi:type IV secretory pathway VirB6-like protein